MYQDELKICKQIPSSSNNQSKQLQDDISVELEASINLLSTLDSSADSDSAAVLNSTIEKCSTTIILVRKCMKLAIGKRGKTMNIFNIGLGLGSSGFGYCRVWIIPPDLGNLLIL